MKSDSGEARVLPYILLLNGPAGVGKSTVGAHLRELCPGTVCIHGDTLRSFAPHDASSSLGSGSTYRAGAALAAAYLGMGASRIVFEYVFEGPEQVEHFKDAIPTHVTWRLVTLWAPLEVVSARELGRLERERLGDRVEACYRKMEANLKQLGTIVPTEGLSPREIAERIRAL